MAGILPSNYISPAPITADNVHAKWAKSLNEDDDVTVEACYVGIGPRVIRLVQ